ncbi:MAG: hypothetical protein D3904_00905 [Candidatus Electrothrix sp. EH2]|nr:hypothetical protein [Candidatus Electrothrix sp. EH2]
MLNDFSFRLLTSLMRMKPSFILPGETKCGTTTFYRCLNQHPLIISADIKEPNNFIQYGGTSIFCRMHYPFFFRKFFNRKLIAGEGSVEYLSKRRIPTVIHSLLPDVKLIIMLRNPITRALSDFKMMKEHGDEPDDFATVVRNVFQWLRDTRLTRLVEVAQETDNPPLRYLTKGCYIDTITPWLDRFPRKNILFVRSENFFKDPQEQLDLAFKHLNLPSYQVKNIPHLRKARISLPVDRETIELLADYFQPYNTRLGQLLGDEFTWEKETHELLSTFE